MMGLQEGRVKGLRVIVIGGSIGGLAAGIALHRAGVEVDVFEKSSADMGERGAGLVLQPDLVEFVEHYELAKADQLAVVSRSRQHLSQQGDLLSRQPVQQQMTSWKTIYSCLKQAFPDNRYHHNRKLTDLTQTTDKVIASFGDRIEMSADLIIAADGANSTVRQLLFPEIRPEYAGYVAWRGVIPEQDLDPTAAELLLHRFTFFTQNNTQMLSYLIPGPKGEITPGQRRLNWVWYWDVPGSDLPQLLTDRTGVLQASSIPQGLIRPELIDQQRQNAEQVLPPIFQEIFRITSEPFIQPIMDLEVPKMVFERVILIGDAAFIVRPHTASGTAKAIADVAQLISEFNRYPEDIPTALMTWQPRQIQIGQYLRSMGVRYRDLAAQSEAL